jgi:hypothetical protein
MQRRMSAMRGEQPLISWGLTASQYHAEESLNVAAAASICLYESLRSRQVPSAIRPKAAIDSVDASGTDVA